MENMPVASSESVYMLGSFNNSDFPVYLQRFFNLVPLSVFMLFTGNLMWKWEKILGPGLRS
jgi:hypothetical protein